MSRALKTVYPAAPILLQKVRFGIQFQACECAVLFMFPAKPADLDKEATMHRRTFLRAMGTCIAVSLMPLSAPAQNGAPAIPVLMFHKVDDVPHDPESISSAQFAALLANMWATGFYPVNMSDILGNSVDRIVPKGLKPVGITADDAHRSIVFSRAAGSREGQRNVRSLTEILRDSLKPFGRIPRATFFVGRVEDDRVSKRPEGYFGNYTSLSAVMEGIKDMPGVEIGYHTVRHTRMSNMDANQVREIIKEQMDDFKALGVLERVSSILAYPYGVRPSPEGIAQLRRMGFKGAVLAYPGVREAMYDTVPSCAYDGTLLTDPFLIPRVCIGSHAYAYRNAAKSGSFVPIDPLEDFRKDVTEALPDIYVSKGQA